MKLSDLTSVNRFKINFSPLKHNSMKKLRLVMLLITAVISNNLLANGTGQTGCIPDFGYFRDSSTSAKTYYFHDASQGSPVMWLWNFGDGNTSTLQNPVHTYYKTLMIQSGFA